MTRFGKLLVFFNVGFSLMLVAWAFSVYANGIDWSNSKDKSGAPTGEYAIRAAKLEEAWKGIPAAQARWLRQRKDMSYMETHLLQERVWYDQELRHVYVGKSKDKPILQVEIAAKDDPNSGIRAGQIVLDKNDLPHMVPLVDPKGNPLQLLSLTEYNQNNEKVLNSLKQVMQKHEKQIDESNRLTDLIIGDKAKGLRGLQDRINDEREKDAAVRAEQKLVEPLLINTVVEAQLINKRHAQLVKRVEELRKLKVVSK